MSLREVLPGEEPALLPLVEREPLYNLFLISNLTQGLAAPGSQAWVDEAAGGVLMRRGANWMIDCGEPGLFHFDGAAALMDASTEVRGLSGRPASVDPLFVRLRAHRCKMNEETFASLSDAPADLPVAGLPRPARPDDLDEAAAIYAVADDMRRSREQVQAMLPTLWVLEDEGQVRCVGNVHGSTARAAMIGAVFTPVEFRRRGYAASLVQAMSRQIVASGRTACLFYVNPDAGRIYRRLGFRELGPWRLVRFGV